MFLKKPFLILISAILIISIGCSDDDNPTNGDTPNGNGDTTNYSPRVPSSPYPANISYNVAFNLTLNWTCSDPDDDPLTYDLYLGDASASLPLYAHGLTTNSYSLNNLEPGQVYFWKISASDPDDNVVESPTWMFCTNSEEQHYSKLPNTGIPYAIIVRQAQVDGSPLQIGDEIGVFDGPLCVGSHIIEDDSVINVSVVGSDESMDLWGFESGNSIIIKIWLQDLQQEIIPEVTYEEGNGTFNYGPFSAVLLEGSTTEE